ncbi:germ cell nuclear acidic protein-like [Adelges cooleyi]|uniref:germ cell nuclear acidic protein-like n=1 Tax=Adelges cooleyi TaxID=133065 RepID=UPI00217F8D9A|nr:germ cell nuclear acidic protein-like [Adelges cooleyi]
MAPLERDPPKFLFDHIKDINEDFLTDDEEELFPERLIYNDIDTRDRDTDEEIDINTDELNNYIPEIVLEVIRQWSTYFNSAVPPLVNNHDRKTEDSDDESIETDETDDRETEDNDDESIETDETDDRKTEDSDDKETEDNDDTESEDNDDESIETDETDDRETEDNDDTETEDSDDKETEDNDDTESEDNDDESIETDETDDRETEDNDDKSIETDETDDTETEDNDDESIETDETDKIHDDDEYSRNFMPTYSFDARLAYFNAIHPPVNERRPVESDSDDPQPCSSSGLKRPRSDSDDEQPRSTKRRWPTSYQSESEESESDNFQ